MGLWARVKEAVIGTVTTAWDVVAFVWDWPVSGMLSSVSRTTQYLTLSLPVATGRYALTVYSDPKARKVARHMAHIGTHDLLPLAIASQSAQLLTDYLTDTDEASAMGGYLWLIPATTVTVAYYVYKARQSTQIALHQSVVMLENGRAITKPPMTICEEERCSTARFLQGGLRDSTNFWITTLSLNALSAAAKYFFPALSPVVNVLTVYHNGRAILTYCLPVCDRHKMEYLKENAELAFSLGIFHALLNAGIVNLLSLTGASREHYETLFSSVLIIAAVSIAAQLSLPKAVNVSRRTNWVDPIDRYQRGVGVVFDFITFAIKKKGPRLIRDLLENPAESKHWDELKAWMQKPVVRYPRYILTPPATHSIRDLIKDPIVADDWPALRRSALVVLKHIHRFRQTKTFTEEVSTWGRELWQDPWSGLRNIFIDVSLNAASLTPKQSARLTEWVRGLPKIVIEGGLKLLNDKDWMKWLEKVTKEIKDLDPEEPAPLNSQTDTPSEPETAMPPAPEKSQLPIKDPDPAPLAISQSPAIKPPTATRGEPIRLGGIKPPASSAPSAAGMYRIKPPSRPSRVVTQLCHPRVGGEPLL